LEPERRIVFGAKEDPVPGYDFQVNLTLENKRDQEKVVRIPRGSLIEPSSMMRTQQSAVVKRDYVFRLGPREIRPVILEAECWNRHLAPPKAAPGKITPFAGKVQTTTEIWSVSDSRSPTTSTVSPLTRPRIMDLVLEVGGEWATSALKFAVEKGTVASPEMAGRRVVGLKNEIDASCADPKKLKEIVARENLRLTATDIREWLIRSDSVLSGSGEPDGVDPLTKFIELLYAYNRHDLSSALYLEAKELADLKERLTYTISSDKKSQLIELMRKKSSDIMDAFPEVDKILHAGAA
jgi:hypothetical protein